MDTIVYASDGQTLLARAKDGQLPSCGYFCAYLISWWREQPQFGATPDQRLDKLRHGGRRIVTTLDAKEQTAAQKAVTAQSAGADDRDEYAVVSVRPGSGAVTAMAASRPYHAAAPPSPGQDPDGAAAPGPAPDDETVFTGGPGSRPLLAGAAFTTFAIAAAVDRGIPLAHVINTKRRYASGYLVDPASPVACQGNHWCPSNTGDPAYLSGPRTMWEALGHNVITYLVPMVEQIGAEHVVDTAKDLGIPFDRVPQAASAHAWGALALGPVAVPPLALADAYAGLASGGKYCPPHPLRDAASNCRQVLPENVAWATLDAARCAVGDRSAFGDRCGPGTPPAGSVRGIVGQPVAGQLGSSDLNQGWTLALTSPQLATVAIAGRSGCSGCPPEPTKATAAQAITIGAGTQRDALRDNAGEDFVPPDRTHAFG